MKQTIICSLDDPDVKIRKYSEQNLVSGIPISDYFDGIIPVTEETYEFWVRKYYFMGRITEYCKPNADGRESYIRIEVIGKPVTKDIDDLDIIKNHDKKPDMVNHPPHYQRGGVETIDIIKMCLTEEEYLGYLKGNIIKYRERAGLKGNEEQDLAKAKWYYDELNKQDHDVMTQRYYANLD